MVLHSQAWTTIIHLSLTSQSIQSYAQLGRVQKNRTFWELSKEDICQAGCSSCQSPHLTAAV